MLRLDRRGLLEYYCWLKGRRRRIHWRRWWCLVVELIYIYYVYCSDADEKDMFFEMVELKPPPAAATAEEEELLKKPMPMKEGMMTAVGRVEAS